MVNIIRTESILLCDFLTCYLLLMLLCRENDDRTGVVCTRDDFLRSYVVDQRGEISRNVTSYTDRAISVISIFVARSILIVEGKIIAYFSSGVRYCPWIALVIRTLNLFQPACYKLQRSDRWVT